MTTLEIIILSFMYTGIGMCTTSLKALHNNEFENNSLLQLVSILLWPIAVINSILSIFLAFFIKK